MKNSADQGGCYPQKPKAEVDNTLREPVRRCSAYWSENQYADNIWREHFRISTQRSQFVCNLVS